MGGRARHAPRLILMHDCTSQLIHEARESSYDIQAARDSLEVASSRAFSLHFEMLPIDTLPASPTSLTEEQTCGEGVEPALPQLLSAVARLAMVQIYRTRRRDLRMPFRQQHESSKSTRSRPGQAPSAATSTILGTLLDLATYYNYTASLERILLAVRNAVASLRLSDSAIEFASSVSTGSPGRQGLAPPHLDFVRLCDSFDDIVASLTGGGPVRLGGLATLLLASPDRSLDFTFSSPTSLVLHLPRQTLAIRGLDHLVAVLQHAVRAAVLKLCEDLLEDITAARGKSAQDGSWEVLPTNSLTQDNSRARARRSGPDGSIVEFMWVASCGVRPKFVPDRGLPASSSIFPQVQVQRSPIAREDIECSIKLDLVHSRRSADIIARKTFASGLSSPSGVPDEETLRQWLESRLESRCKK